MISAALIALPAVASTVSLGAQGAGTALPSSFAMHDRVMPVDESSRERIVDVARRFLLESLQSRFDRIDLQSVGRVMALSLDGSARLRARLAPGSAGVGKRMCIWVDALVDGVPRRSVPVWFAVSAYKKVLVTEAPLSSRTKLHLRDLRVDERDVAALPSPPLTQYVDLSSIWLRRPLIAGAIVTQADIEPMPAVRRDRGVAVSVVAGDIRIETRGTALKDGRVGDVVAVRASEGREPYSAKVVGIDAVLVEDN